MWWTAAYGYDPREWNFSKTASGSSITFNDMDDLNVTFYTAIYYTVALLYPIPTGEAARQRTSCFSTKGGKLLNL